MKQQPAPYFGNPNPCVGVLLRQFQASPELVEAVGPRRRWHLHRLLASGFMRPDLLQLLKRRREWLAGRGIHVG